MGGQHWLHSFSNLDQSERDAPRSSSNLMAHDAECDKDAAIINQCHTFGSHCRWTPGTDNDVMSIVTQRSKNTVPVNANIRRITINLSHTY